MRKNREEPARPPGNEAAPDDLDATRARSTRRAPDSQATRSGSPPSRMPTTKAPMSLQTPIRP